MGDGFAGAALVAATVKMPLGLLLRPQVIA